MVQDLGPGFDDGADRLLVALKIRNEHLNTAAGGLAANLLNHKSEGARTAQVIVIAIHAGDDGVLESELSHSLRHAARLVEVNGLRPAFGHRAEPAAARAQVTQHHERRSLVVPALANIRAVRAFAHGVERERARQTLEVVVVLAHGSAGL